MPAPWFAVATHFKGLAEVHGATDNPKIVEMFRVAGHPEVKDDETPWCAAFVGACLRLSGYASSESVGARSYEHFGDDLRDRPQRGCIAVFWRESASSGKGHVAFFIEETADYVSVLGGNQSDAVTVRSYPKDRLLGYRWPKKTAELPVGTTLPNILTIDPSLAPPHVMIGVSPPPAAGEALAEGAFGRAVQALQTALASKGFSPGSLDGAFGPLTRTALANFQRAIQMPATGVADAATLHALGIAETAPSAVAVIEEQRQPMPQDVLKALIEALARLRAPTVVTPTPTPAPQADVSTLVQALVAALAGKAVQAPGTASANATPATTPPVLSSIDKLLGGEALAGKKTMLAVLAYVVLAILQAVGVAGTATGTSATPTGEVLTALIGGFGALGGLSKIDRIVQVLAAAAGQARPV